MKLVGICILLLGSIAKGQTPPIKPQTPDVKVPPPIELPGPVDAEASGKPLTAAEAVDIALRRQPGVVIAMSDVRAAQGRLQQSRAGLFPQLSVSSAFNDSSQIRGGSPTGGGGGINRFQSSISLDQLLFDFERTRDEVRQQSALERATRQALTAYQQSLALQVKQAFYNYTEARKLVDVANANVENRQRQLALANARLESGLGAPGDVVRAKTNLADAVIALTTARNAATTSRVGLARLLGVDPRTPINPGESSEAAFAAEEVAGLVETALKQRPEVLEARERVTAAHLGVSVASKTSVPRFDITAAISARGANDPLSSQSGTFGVSVKWTFGDGGLAAGRTTEAKALEDAARARLIDTTQTVISDVSQAYVDLKSAEQRLETAQVQLANARELVRISEGRYQGGIGQFLEVTDAQSSLVAAERNVAQAEADVQRSRALLSRAIGAR